MKNILELTLEDLKETSKNWDGSSKYLLVYLEGSGDMFGGSAKFVYVTLHGKNSIYETGSIRVDGIAKMSYNIARGGNGETCQVVSYYKGVTDFKDTYTLNPKPTYKVTIEGSCGSGEEALRSFLRAEQDWII